MSEESEEAFAHIDRTMGINIINFGYVNIHETPDDVENTLLVSLTERELAILTYGLWYVLRLFPELGKRILELSLKFKELGSAQGFMASPEEEEEDERSE